MVTEIPTFEEFFGSNQDNLPEGAFQYISPDRDEELIGIATLLILYNFYTKYQYKTISYVEQNIEKDLAQLKKSLDTTTEKELKLLADKYKISLLNEDSISSFLKDKVKLDFNIKGTLKTFKLSVTGIVNQLQDDIKTKIQVYRDALKKLSDFNIKSNINRAVRRLRDTVSFNAQTIKQKITRSYQKFKYGPKMLYKWVVSNRNTCMWCYNLASYPPQLIDMWPLDHIHGNCGLKPINPDVLSDDFVKLVEESTKYAPVARLNI